MGGGEVEGRGGEEWARGGRWRGLDGPEMETPGRRSGGGGEEIAGEILKRGNKGDKEKIQVTPEHFPNMHPAGMTGSRR